MLLHIYSVCRICESVSARPLYGWMGRAAGCTGVSAVRMCRSEGLAHGCGPRAGRACAGCGHGAPEDERGELRPAQLTHGCLLSADLSLVVFELGSALRTDRPHTCASCAARAALVARTYPGCASAAGLLRSHSPLRLRPVVGRGSRYPRNVHASPSPSEAIPTALSPVGPTCTAAYRVHDYSRSVLWAFQLPRCSRVRTGNAGCPIRPMERGVNDP